MAKTISSHLSENIWKEGYVPRLLIEIPYLEEHFCYGGEITIADIESGSDGVCTSAGDVFTSASATFNTNKVYIGDKLVITGGANAGTYIIDSVDSETQITITTTFPSYPSSSQTYSIHRVYQDEISSPPVFSYDAKREGGVALTGNISFGIANQDYFSNFYRSSNFPKPEGQTIYCHLLFDDGSATLSASDRFQIFQGVIDGSPSIDNSEVNIQVQSKNILSDIYIGDKLENDSYSESGWIEVQTIVESVGKIPPLIFGDYKIDALQTIKSLYDPNPPNMEIFPEFLYLGDGIVNVGVTSGVYKKWIISEILLSSRNDIPALDEIVGCVIYRVEDNFVMVLGQTKTTGGTSLEDGVVWTRYGTNGCIVALGKNDVAGKVDNCRMMTPVVKNQMPDTDSSASAYTTITDEDLMADWVMATSGTLDIGNPTTNGDYASVILSIPEFTDPYDSNQEVQVGIFAQLTRGGGAGGGNFEVSVRAKEPTLTSWSVYTESDLYNNTGSSTLILSPAISGADTPTTKIEIRLKKLSTVTSYTASLEIFHVIAIYDGTKIFNSDDSLYFSGRGEFIGDWSTGRSTSEGYTETHQDDDAYSTIISERTDGVTNIAEQNDFRSAAGGFGSVNAGDILNISAGDTVTIGKYRVQSQDTSQDIKVEGLFRGYLTGLTFKIGRSELLANPISFIEQIARDHGDLVDANINMDSFNIASNDLSTAATKFFIKKQEKLFDFLGEYSELFNTLLYFDEQNRLAAKVFDSSAGFSFNDKITEIQDTTGRNFVNLFSDNPEKAFNFDNSAYNTITIYETGTGGTNFAVALLGGGYETATSAASKLQTAINSSSSWDYTVSYSSSTHKFTISLDNPTGRSFQLAFNAGTSDFCCEMFGFYKGSTHTGGTSYTSDFPIVEKQILGNLIMADSFRLYRNNKIVNKLQLTLNDNTIQTYEDTTSQSDYGIKQKKKDHKFTNDITTADIYGNNVIARNKDKLFTCEFDVVGITPIIYDLWDIICIDHPLVSGIYSNVYTEKWHILSLKLNADSMSYHVIAEKI